MAASGTSGKSSIRLPVGGGVYIQVGLCRANLIIFEAPFVSLEPEAPTIDWQGAWEKKGGVPVDFAARKAGYAFIRGGPGRVLENLALMCTAP